MFILIIAINLDELLENSRLTSCAPNGKPSRVVKVAKDSLIMFIVAVLWSKDSWTDGAGKVLDVKFLAQCGNVATPQCTPAICADEIEPSKVIGLTQGE
jgi:hypothetical protein